MPNHAKGNRESKKRKEIEPKPLCSAHVNRKDRIEKNRYTTQHPSPEGFVDSVSLKCDPNGTCAHNKTQKGIETVRPATRQSEDEEKNGDDCCNSGGLNQLHLPLPRGPHEPCEQVLTRSTCLERRNHSDPGCGNAAESGFLHERQRFIRLVEKVRFRSSIIWVADHAQTGGYAKSPYH